MATTVNGRHVKRRIWAALAATAISLAAALAWAGTATASTTASAAVSADSCDTWATGWWGDNCQVSLGSSSTMVLAVQYLVSGACGGGGLTYDGIFGANTEHAVECFQNQHNLSPDGTVGSGTWAALQKTLTADPPDGNWYYYQTSEYDDPGFVGFREWGPSGRWYVIDLAGNWAAMST